MKRRLRERTERFAAEILEVPKDTLEHVPRITLIGDIQVVVENYRAILAFEPQCIRIALSEGEVVIRGQQLVIRTIVPEEIVIEGTVSGVEYP